MAYRIHGIDPFPPLVALSLDPMSIEISKKTIDIVGAGRVTVPFCGVIAEEGFVLTCVGCLQSTSDQAGTR